LIHAAHEQILGIARGDVRGWPPSFKKLGPILSARQRSRVDSLTCQRWASSFWEMHLPSMGVSFRRCYQASMNVLFAMEAKRFGEICPHVAPASDALAAFVALGVLSCVRQPWL